MPNSNFNSFLANYRSAIVCKKVRFCIPWTIFNFFILKTLLEDGYIWSYKLSTTTIDITAIDLAISIQFNRIMCYTTQKRTKYVSFWKLVELSKTGGYYILSTKRGIMNDSNAWTQRLGGTLLFAIF
jgi:ribosomal protein S8